METNLKSLRALIDDDALASICNIIAFLYDISDNLNWLGIYLFKNNKLYLGPFQGKPACTPLSLDKGVCAKSFNDQIILNVKDVHTFPGHIACDSASKSELVIPLTRGDQRYGVLDIDSPILNRFSKEDEFFFAKAAEEIANIIAKQSI